MTSASRPTPKAPPPTDLTPELLKRLRENTSPRSDLGLLLKAADRRGKLLGEWMKVHGQHCGSCCRFDDAGKVITPADACVCYGHVKDTRAEIGEGT